MESLAQPAAFEALCQKADVIDWVVYAKRPFGGPEQVLKYLARYTHRGAISNRRLLLLTDGRVTCLPDLFTSATLDSWPTATACRSLLPARNTPIVDSPASSHCDSATEEPVSHRCPVCKTGRLVFMQVLPAAALACLPPPLVADTS